MLNSQKKEERMKKVLSVIFIILLILSAASCGRPANETTDIAKEEFRKLGKDDAEIIGSALCGISGKAVGLYLAEYGKGEEMCIAVEYEVSDKNSYVYSDTFIPDRIYDKIYTLTWHGKTILFVANEDCATVFVNYGEDGNRVDDIRKSSHPYLTIEENGATFLCYDENMKEVAR